MELSINTACHSTSQSGGHVSTTLTSGQRLTELAGFPAGSSKEAGSDVERFKVSGQALSIKALMRRAASGQRGARRVPPASFRSEGKASLCCWQCVLTARLLQSE